MLPLLALPALLAPADVLHDWCDRRAAAWATDDVGGLHALYRPGSAAGAEDARMLRAWRSRGLRVTGLETQLLAVGVRRASADRLDLVVTDRLVGGVAVGDGVRVPLPRDAATTRRLVLERVAGEWRLVQASAARTTSWTVRSWKE